ncbi:uncharacterized protein EV420DRAFT_1644039 [Desarmillaria tabescens]|uniref:Uncharacterized protein n=1 Tax=Armillaria tabescens TaxID=1929756 RepID=A0AA39KC78_ARMTA|nr:uncharacterized protein EV420DRAFT_1644039 [Desarmillaria tabescens]KAK0457290.1 hypothetical protein EV420DRAFT_1644039 [Desarmillaria tabescens]
MDHSDNPWSSPPPSYSTFPNNRPGTDHGPSNERTPLNQPKPKRIRKCSSTLNVLIVLLLLVAFTWHCVNDYSNIHRTDVQEKIRQRQELERLKRIEYEDAQRKQAHEREDEERRKVFEEEDQWKRREREKQDREIEREETRRKLAHEEEDDRRRREREREDKAIELEEKRRRLAHMKEDEQRRLAHEKEDRERKEEKGRWDREIEQEERQRREHAIQAKEDAIREDEERRKRAGLTWHDLTAEKQCLSYETRMYHAELVNIPYGEDAESWCMKTVIDIHGVTYDHPDFCTKERHWNGAISIVGHWTVTSNEPTCKTWWSNHEKKGCYGTHKMRVEAQMLNHQEPWDNWAEMCFSTPSEFAWKSFAHPDTCENKGKYGIVGSWFIDVDESECP